MLVEDQVLFRKALRQLLEEAQAQHEIGEVGTAREAGSLQRFMIDDLRTVELLGVDELLDHADVHFRVVLAERIVEAALRQAHVQRHLAAFEALDGNARTALLTLLAAAAGLALARADAPADADPALACAVVVADIIQFHSALAFAF